MERRVVVTGLGVISPVGIGQETFWKSLMAGKTRILTSKPTVTLPTLIFFIPR